MSTLKSTIESLASQFAMSILGALRSASIEEVMGVTGAPRSSARASSAAAGSGASAPAAKAASAPAKRGPGRPKKVAAAPAEEAPAAAAPAKRGPGRPKKAAAASAPAPKAAKPKAASKPGRLPRRSADDIGALVESIVSLLQANPGGLRAEQIRGALGLDAKELPRPLADALAAGTITKTGQKRATTYTAAGAGGGRGKKRR